MTFWDEGDQTARVLIVRVTYKNSTTDSKKIALQILSEERMIMMFSDLLNKAQSKLRLPAFKEDFEVQLLKYDDSEEPMTICNGDRLVDVFPICDKPPIIEFLLEKVDISIHNDESFTAINNNMIIPTDEYSNIREQYRKLGVLNKEELITNIMELCEKVESLKKENYYSGDPMQGLRKVLSEQLQLYREQLQIKMNQKNYIVISKCDVKREGIEKAASGFSFPLNPPILDYSNDLRGREEEFEEQEGSSDEESVSFDNRNVSIEKNTDEN
jgi:hypothetical protein